MSVTIDFIVQRPNCGNVPGKCEKVLNWYKSRHDVSDEFYENLHFEHVQDNRFRMSFNIKKENTQNTRKNALFIAETIADPDEDGNYPLFGVTVYGEVVDKTLKYDSGKKKRVYKKKNATGTKKNKASASASAPNTTKKAGRCPKGYRRIPAKTGTCVKKD